jgi:diadenylate cyclase
MTIIISDITLLFQRITWLSILDILFVTVIFYSILVTLRDTQAMVLLRGTIFLVIIVGLITSIFKLPALSWLIRTAMPALIFSIPVIFTPEIRRALEKLGHARFGRILLSRSPLSNDAVDSMIKAVVSACIRLADHHYGALIVLQRQDNLNEYINTGVKLESRITAELLIQVFYPGTPLHDGAAVVVGDRLQAAGCVMPLSKSKALNQSPERESGLRHRAALGIAEVSDAIALVVSEETGTISMANRGRLLKRISAEKLENYLKAFYNQSNLLSSSTLLARLEHMLGRDRDEEA